MTNLEKQTIIANFRKVKSIQIANVTDNVQKIFFADQNGNNVFSDTILPRKEFGHKVGETQNSVSFGILVGEDDVLVLTVPKKEPLVVNQDSEVSKAFLKYIIGNAITPISKRRKKTQQTNSTNVTKKASL